MTKKYLTHDIKKYIDLGTIRFGSLITCDAAEYGQVKHQKRPV
jgi:hypothetical protein